MKILSVVGARPQFVKLAAISRAIARKREAGEDLEHVIVHTGQHYDAGMSDVFFNDLQIPEADFNLAIGSAQHGAQTGRMLERLEEVILEQRPDWTLVYGDTNSTLAGTLAAVKQHLPVAHLEAGLRSFNRKMPEEINRIVTDHAADLLLAPTEVAASHLDNEGLSRRTVVTGDVMADICLTVADAARNDPASLKLPGGIDPESPYLVATIHRAENTDDPNKLRRIIDGLQALKTPVALFAHPRLVDRASKAGLELQSGMVKLSPPAPYPGLIAAVQRSVGVITDSGGLQKESFLLQIPCTTVRSETEWVETLQDDWNILVSDSDSLISAASRPFPTAPQGVPYGRGDASEKAIQALLDFS
ncbi:UDP-N-acetyl glucosamine 2-epimerase [Citricoccus zhacaiensis]|uniref:UDP-N-acetyl glucosamine 2-epimerase n=1 Tax=Citricoccus zhacaiensis TaxID=489142 RepID=A0ABQ2M652_9MICC|nr:UDP-N-acetylglucosamine 2-epimerase (non-hydrolyzing) [Citricoccus zhacaiensis]GGO46368.1 UDP-N-acetyl glucosamine 2-epimerase [Citricoccus zhacaiensis]